jgi:hypothetical protein
MRIAELRMRKHMFSNAFTIIDTIADATTPSSVVQEGHEWIDVTLATIASNDLRALDDT